MLLHTILKLVLFQKFSCLVVFLLRYDLGFFVHFFKLPLLSFSKLKNFQFQIIAGVVPLHREETSSRFLLKRLASSSETDQGGLSPPPFKRQRLIMQSHSSVLNGGCAENGTSLPLKEGPTTSKPSTVANGDCTEAETNSKTNTSVISNLSNSDKEVIRLVGQHLCSLGLQ